MVLASADIHVAWIRPVILRSIIKLKHWHKKSGVSRPFPHSCPHSATARLGRAAGNVYFDLATWHLINTIYAPNRVIELREMISLYADALRYQRLMTVVTKRLGHHLAALALKFVCPAKWALAGHDNQKCGGLLDQP